VPKESQVRDSLKAFVADIRRGHRLYLAIWFNHHVTERSESDAYFLEVAPEYPDEPIKIVHPHQNEGLERIERLHHWMVSAGGLEAMLAASATTVPEFTAALKKKDFEVLHAEPRSLGPRANELFAQQPA
jgi:hypothetical protein